MEDLRNITEPQPDRLARFTEIPPAPPAVADLLDKAPKTSKWDTFDFLRTYVLSNVTATGTGSPKSVPPERIQDMLAGSKEGTPYEIVAAQAMLARWAGIPSRIGYGFDGGEVTGEPAEGAQQARGAAQERRQLPRGLLPQVRLAAGHRHADQGQADGRLRPATQRQDPNVLPSDDIQIGLFVPVLVPPPSPLPEQIRQAVSSSCRRRCCCSCST